MATLLVVDRAAVSPPGENNTTLAARALMVELPEEPVLILTGAARPILLSLVDGLTVTLDSSTNALTGEPDNPDSEMEVAADLLDALYLIRAGATTPDILNLHGRTPLMRATKLEEMQDA